MSTQLSARSSIKSGGCSLAATRPQSSNPYPWLKIQETLTEEGFSLLRENMPKLSLFNRDEGVPRAYGQASHDRYCLHYFAGLTLPQPWLEFLSELQSETYQTLLHRMLGPASFLLTFEWHYAWQGCSVSPHCDAARKIATHLFISIKKTGSRTGVDRR